MNQPTLRARSLRLLAAAALALLPGREALAGPGAHGPNGEHLDAPAAMAAGPALPRVEAHTEAFELVAELRAAELVIVVDRYDSNEPVLGAQLEVETGSAKAVAAFRADQGDYVAADAALLKALAAPGEHPLVFTLVAGADSDLLDGTLVSPTAAATAVDDPSLVPAWQRPAWIGGGIAALALVASLAWWRRRRRSADNMGEAL